MEPQSETIAAIATAPGEGAIGIVRLSGREAIAILAQLFTGRTPPRSFDSHRLYLGHVTDEAGKPIDQAMAVWMQAPRSFTGEDCVELHCHGGRQILGNILNLALRHGARLARPGEFSERAYLNGKVDLIQAEAICDMIRAKSDKALSQSLAQLAGQLSHLIEELKQELIGVKARLEAGIDFVEAEIDPENIDSLCHRLKCVTERIDTLIQSFERGRILREGLRVVIVGKPNVGKSSLLNALLKEERAIVHEAAGTTRDFIEETLTLQGVLIRLTDTAGIREGRSDIEIEGIRRAYARMGEADLLLAVLDGSSPLTDEDRSLIQFLKTAGSKHLLIQSKIDLPPVWDKIPALSGPILGLSNRSGQGLHAIESALLRFALGGADTDSESCVLTHVRHKNTLANAARGVQKTIASLRSGLSHEFAVSDLNTAIAELKEITGEITHDEILDKIFSEFCIGK